MKKFLLAFTAITQIAFILSKRVNIFDCDDSEDSNQPLVKSGSLDINEVKIKNLEARLSEMVDQVSKLQEESEENKNWKVVGKVKDIEEVIKKYPITHYMYGISYNSRNVERVMITRWNRGLRVFVRHLYTQGDDASKMWRGTAAFTFGTDDSESKSDFYHRYLNSDFKPLANTHNSNKYDNQTPLYVKQFS